VVGQDAHSEARSHGKHIAAYLLQRGIVDGERMERELPSDAVQKIQQSLRKPQRGFGMTLHAAEDMIRTSDLSLGSSPVGNRNFPQRQQHTRKAREAAPRTFVEQGKWDGRPDGGGLQHAVVLSGCRPAVADSGGEEKLSVSSSGKRPTAKGARGPAPKKGVSGSSAPSVQAAPELEALPGLYKAMMSNDWRERREALGQCIDTVLKVGRRLTGRGRSVGVGADGCAETGGLCVSRQYPDNLYACGRLVQAFDRINERLEDGNLKVRRAQEGDLVTDLV
jgi:hypothetical protein